MCYSATASFVAGGALTVIGVITLRRAMSRAELPFAAIPLLFGIQQLIEGVIWLSFRYEVTELNHLATYLYTCFSHVLWPVYVPVAIGLLEQDPLRRKIIRYIGGIGAATALLLAVLIATQPLTTVVGKHIVYTVEHHYEWPMMLLYIIATCMAPCCSSYPLIRLLGALTLLMFVATYWFYTAALFSVWCFFAAILSTIIYLYFRNERSLVAPPVHDMGA